jgi:hypothetical protein
MRRTEVTIVANPPTDPTVAIAVLYERIGHVIEKVDALGAKIDAQSAHRDQMLADLEERVETIERQITGVRGFLTGIAALAGLLGGGVAAGIAQMIGN